MVWLQEASRKNHFMRHPVPSHSEIFPINFSRKTTQNTFLEMTVIAEFEEMMKIKSVIFKNVGYFSWSSNNFPFWKYISIPIFYKFLFYVGHNISWLPKMREKYPRKVPEVSDEAMSMVRFMCLSCWPTGVLNRVINRIFIIIGNRISNRVLTWVHNRVLNRVPNRIFIQVFYHNWQQDFK